jgi:hypothetical protein
LFPLTRGGFTVYFTLVRFLFPGHFRSKLHISVKLEPGDSRPACPGQPAAGAVDAPITGHVESDADVIGVNGGLAAHIERPAPLPPGEAAGQAELDRDR